MSGTIFVMIGMVASALPLVSLGGHSSLRALSAPPPYHEVVQNPIPGREVLSKYNAHFMGKLFLNGFHVIKFIGYHTYIIYCPTS